MKWGRMPFALPCTLRRLREGGTRVGLMTIEASSSMKEKVGSSFDWDRSNISSTTRDMSHSRVAWSNSG